MASVVIHGLKWLYGIIRSTAKYWVVGFVAAVIVLFVGLFLYDSIWWVEALALFFVGLIFAVPLVRYREQEGRKRR